jgi:two-component system sensor histidine kinase BaeS
MFKSPILRKIILIILTVSLGGILILGFMINFSLNHQFQSYLNRNESGREQEMLRILADLYITNSGWQGLQLRLVPGRIMGNLHYVTDENGRIVIVNRRFIMRGNQEEPLVARPILAGGIKVGTAFFRKNRMQNILSKQDQLFRRTINLSILGAVLITGLFSLGVAALFARRLSRPITEMNRAARNMTNGNLETRIQDLPRDELGELGASLNELAGRLLEADKLRKKMTADVAHDLRTPLATVKSHLEGIIDQVISPSRENLESLLEEINRLTALVNDLQAISEADTTIHHFHMEPIELKGFLEDVAHKLAPLFNEKSIDLKQEELAPVTVELDRPALTKILQNLLANALKFTPSGKQVVIKVAQLNGSVVIEVRDQGIGISAKDLPYIFERFYRADPSRNRESGGFGLGLTIVKELTEAMGGTVEVESVVGEGSTFKIRLPIRRASRA